MGRDFIADLLYYLYSMDEEEHPMTTDAQERLTRKINEVLNNQNTHNRKESGGEENHG